MAESQKKVPALAEGDLIVFERKEDWNLVRIDYSVTRRWLSIARGTTMEQLDAAIAAAKGGATKVTAAELKGDEPAAPTPEKKPAKAAKAPKAKKTAKPRAPKKTTTKRAARDPEPASATEGVDAPSPSIE